MSSKLRTAIAKCPWLPLTLLWGLTPGCGSSTPDTTPAVRILSPLTNQHVAVGQPVMVEFEIGGIDNGVPFQLAVGETKVTGQGRVAAQVDTFGNRLVAVQNDPATMVINVPDGTYATPSEVIVAGTMTIYLSLQYNDGTPLIPQRQAQVVVQAP